MWETDGKYFENSLCIVGDWVEFISNHVYRSARRFNLNFLLDITELMHGKDGLAYGQSQVKRATTKLLG